MSATSRELLPVPNGPWIRHKGGACIFQEQEHRIRRSRSGWCGGGGTNGTGGSGELRRGAGGGRGVEVRDEVLAELWPANHGRTEQLIASRCSSLSRNCDTGMSVTFSRHLYPTDGKGRHLGVMLLATLAHAASAAEDMALRCSGSASPVQALTVTGGVGRAVVRGVAA